MESYYTTVLAVDFDEKATLTYKENFPGTDVVTSRVEDVVNGLRAGDADIIIGGPPCQSFSVAGKGLGEDDGRNGIPAFIDAVGRVLPRMFIMENVRGLVTKKHKPYFDTVIQALRYCGYQVDWKVLDAVNYGVPQFRKRVWVWGVRNDLHMMPVFPEATHAWPWAGGLERGVTVGWALGLAHTQVDGIWFPGSDGFYAIHKRRSSTRDAQRRDDPVSEPSPTLEKSMDSASVLTAVYGGGSHVALREGKESARDITGEPCTTLNKEAHHGDNSPTVHVYGGGSNHEYNRRAIYRNDKPCNTLSGTNGNDAPIVVPEDVGQSIDLRKGLQKYRWSDAMLQKHPPFEPSAPAQTVQAKFFKGGAEGLLSISGDVEKKPCRTISGGGTETGGAEPVPHPTRELFVRRLTPEECLRLMSAPDDFKFPDNVSKTARYRITGNGQASLMTRHLARAAMELDPKSTTIIDLFCGGGLGACGWHERCWEYLP